MKKPARARTDVAEIERDLVAELAVLRAALQPEDGTPEDVALCSVETFCAVALRIMHKTNPSKVRSEAMTLEIKCRMDGVPVLRGLA